jgi:hypothetical protein
LEVQAATDTFRLAMLDADRVATLVIERARARASATTFMTVAGGATVHHPYTDQEKFAQSFPAFPTIYELAEAIRAAYYTSLLTEEARPCRPRLVFASRELHPPVHLFNEPVPLDVPNLRRLCFAAGSRAGLTWVARSGKLYLTGIIAEEEAPWTRLIISAPATGGLDISCMNTLLVAARGDKVFSWASSSRPQLCAGVGLEIGYLFRNANMEACRCVVDSFVGTTHGGSLWVVDEGANVDGLHIGYRFQASAPWENRVAAEPEHADKMWSSVAHMSGIDGAVLVDCKMRPIGAGVFVDLEKDDFDVQVLQDDGSLAIQKRDQTGGGRHRSAISFCKHHGPAYALVASSDGKVSAVTTRFAGDVPLIAEFLLTEPHSDAGPQRATDLGGSPRPLFLRHL